MFVSFLWFYSLFLDNRSWIFCKVDRHSGVSAARQMDTETVGRQVIRTWEQASFMSVMGLEIRRI